jgi:hypothetical protein
MNNTYHPIVSDVFPTANGLHAAAWFFPQKWKYEQHISWIFGQAKLTVDFTYKL